jgi:gas vesicle protein
MSQHQPEGGLTATMPPGSGEQPREQGSGVVAQAQQQVQQKAEEVKSKAGDQLRTQVDQRSTQAGEQVQAVSEALRTSSGQLREQGKEGPAKLIEQTAGKVEGLGSYLRDSNADSILSDVESWARRRPWAAAGIGVVIGFIGSRFLKASSSRRYDSQLDGSGDYRAPAELPPDLSYETASDVAYEARPGGM